MKQSTIQYKRSVLVVASILLTGLFFLPGYTNAAGGGGGGPGGDPGGPGGPGGDPEEECPPQAIFFLTKNTTKEFRGMTCEGARAFQSDLELCRTESREVSAACREYCTGGGPPSAKVRQPPLKQG